MNISAPSIGSPFSVVTRPMIAPASPSWIDPRSRGPSSGSVIGAFLSVTVSRWMVWWRLADTISCVCPGTGSGSSNSSAPFESDLASTPSYTLDLPANTTVSAASGQSPMLQTFASAPSMGRQSPSTTFPSTRSMRGAFRETSAACLFTSSCATSAGSGGGSLGVSVRPLEDVTSSEST